MFAMRRVVAKGSPCCRRWGLVVVAADAVFERWRCGLGGACCEVAGWRYRAGCHAMWVAQFAGWEVLAVKSHMNLDASSGKWIALVACVLIAAVGGFMYLRTAQQLDGARRSEPLDMVNLDFEMAIACLAISALALVLYAVFGKPHAVTFSAQCWNSVPAPGIHPADLGRLCRWGRQNSGDLVATVLRLVIAGEVAVERGTRVGPKGAVVEDYRLTRLVVAGAGDAGAGAAGAGDAGVGDAGAGAAGVGDVRVVNAVDGAAMKMLFDVIGEGSDEVWAGEVHAYGRHNADAFSQATKAWQAVAKGSARRCGFVDRASEFLHYALWLMALVVVVVGAYMLLGTQSVVPLLCSLVAAAVLLAVSQQMPRLSVGGAEAYEKARALQRWLRGLGGEACAASGVSAVSGVPAVPTREELVGLIPHAFVLREHRSLAEIMRASGYLTEAEAAELVAFADELAVCIMGTAFAAEAVVSTQSTAALGGPVGSITRGASAATGTSNPHEDLEDLFVKKVRAH